MARLDTSQPALVPKMVRLDPNDWDRLAVEAEEAGTNTSALIRHIIGAWLGPKDVPSDD